MTTSAVPEILPPGLLRLDSAPQIEIPTTLRWWEPLYRLGAAVTLETVSRLGADYRLDAIAALETEGVPAPAGSPHERALYCYGVLDALSHLRSLDLELTAPALSVVETLYRES